MQKLAKDSYLFKLAEYFKRAKLLYHAKHKRGKKAGGMVNARMMNYSICLQIGNLEEMERCGINEARRQSAV